MFNNNGGLMFLCEYDGQQHYEPVIFGDFTHDEAVVKYEELVQRDSIKNNYCEEHNIKILRIPYWEYDNIENILNSYINDICS